MSLLEDVFLEDEAGEAQELERIIEGDEYDERPMPDSDENSEKEDEAEEDKRRVDPTTAKPKRVVKNPRVILNPARLTGPRGIQIIPEHFKDFKFKGKGHEREDLDIVLKKLEHWAYRLYPKFEFKDCLKKMETLGNKRPVLVHLTKIRTDQFMSEDTVVQRDSSDDEMPAVPQAPEEDEFDRLLQQQIELARTTPGPGSARKGPPGLATPMVDKSLMMPKATSSPSISEEQKQRMLRNRQLAEERRLTRLKLNNSGNNTNTLENYTNKRSEEKSANNNESANNISLDKDTSYTNIGTKPPDDKTENSSTIMEDAEETIVKAKMNRSNVIDSSDDDENSLVINEAVTVDVHTSRNDDNDEHYKNDRETASDKIQDQFNENGKEVNKMNVASNEELSNTAVNKTERNVKNSHDIEMNEIDTVKRSNSEQSNSHIIADNDHIKTDSEKNLNDRQNIISQNVETQDCIEAEPTIFDKQISVKASLPDVSTGNTETNKVDKEINEIAMEDIMDVDFGDDF